MEDEDNMPDLISIKSLDPEYKQLQKITINSDNFTIGRGTGNSSVIPYLSISRNHCTLKKSENCWFIQDHSSYWITINQKKIGKNTPKKLSHGDIISLEPNNQFVYKFNLPNDDVFEIPTKKMKMEEENDENRILTNMKIKFEESQNYERKHIEEKIQNAKQLQTASINLKQQLQLGMNRKMEQLKSDFAQQIENLKGEKIEVEKQKALLIKERDILLEQVKNEMKEKIEELKEQIQKHNETESELLKENNSLKEKLNKEREDFLSELNRESSSKQDMLDKLEAKMREQEEVRLKEKKELEEMLKRETEQLRLAQEKELKAIAEQKLQRELELQEELANMKKALEEQKEFAEQQKIKADEDLNMQLEQLKKLNDEEKIKIEQMEKEREQAKLQLLEAQKVSERTLAELRVRVTERETELAVLAAERIQHQAEQSSEVITVLQAQLEKMKNQLETAVTEKDTLIEAYNCAGEGTSKDNTLNRVGELMESELQCSICAELFIDALVLNCSHTFCKYCITMWKKKKKDCPICRSPITSENKSLVIDSFIEKMVQNLNEEMKLKREDVLKFRAELVSEMAQQTAGTSRTSFSFDESEISDDEYLEEEEEDEYENEHGYGVFWRSRRYFGYSTDDTGSGSDDGSDTDQSGGEAAGVPASAATTSNASNAATTDSVLSTGSEMQRAQGAGGGPSRVYQARTTAGTGAASAAAPAATGHQAAPSDNAPQSLGISPRTGN